MKPRADWGRDKLYLVRTGRVHTNRVEDILCIGREETMDAAAARVYWVIAPRISRSPRTELLVCWHCRNVDHLTRILPEIPSQKKIDWIKYKKQSRRFQHSACLTSMAMAVYTQGNRRKILWSLIPQHPWLSPGRISQLHCQKPAHAACPEDGIRGNRLQGSAH
jgi:hypothetical protein